jgi:predicted PurR-regulated permease PerM
MSTSEKSNLKKQDTQNIIDIAIKLVVIALMIGWCFQILRPFINIILWAIIIAITLFPTYKILSNKIGNRKKLAAGLIIFLLLAVLIIPTYFLADSLIEGITDLSSGLNKETLTIPPPSDKVSEWPVIGKSVYSFWLSASENLEDLIQKYGKQLVSVGHSVLKALLGTGKGILQIIISIIISGVFLTGSENSSRRIAHLFDKLAGDRGKEFFQTSEITIRNVAKGVLGVAVIQSLFLGIIFIMAGIPYAGLWALICLVLAIIQVGPILVTIPVIIYLFVHFDPWNAILWTVFIVLASLVDNVLKPLLMGKGATVPMLVIFIGALGGFIASGFIGLFIGAIVLSLGYKLYTGWLETNY